MNSHSFQFSAPNRSLRLWSLLPVARHGMAIGLACMVAVFAPQAALADTTVSISKTTNAPSPVPSGQNFSYNLTYSCSSTTGSAHNVVLTDVLPSDLEFVGLSPTSHVASYTAPAVGSSGTVVLTFINPLPSGSAGIVPITVRYKGGITPNGTVALNTATVTSTDAPTASSSVSTTSSAASTWAVGKTGATTATLGPTGVTYTVTLSTSGGTEGQLNLNSAVMVDTLPEGVLPADVLNAAGATVSGTGAAGNPVKLTWSLGTLSGITAQPAASKTVTIRYPATQFSDGQVVQNSVSATGTPIGGTLTSFGPATVNTTLSLPVLTRNLSKVASDTTVDMGQVFDWQLNPTSAAAAALDSFTITDTLPSNFTLQSVYTGTGYTSPPSGNFVAVRYKTTANASYVAWTGSPFAANATLNVSSLGLAVGVYVTTVEINYGTVPVGFSASATAGSRPYLRGVITNPARDSTTVSAGTSGVTSVNNASLTASYNSFALSSVPATATATINTPSPAMTFAKATTNSTPYLGQAFTWQLNPVNSGNTPLDSFILTDTLPGNYTLQSIFTGTGYTNPPGGSFITLRYKTTANSSYSSWTGGPFAANQTLPVSALGLSAGVYVTAVEFNLGTVPVGFACSGTATQRPGLTGVINNPTPDSSVAGNGTTSQNSATLAASYIGVAATPQTATSTVTIPTTTSSATFTKVASNTGPLVGEVFGWQLNPVNSGTSPLDDFTVTDTLPANFTLQSVFTGTGYTAQPSGNFVAIRYKTTVNSNFTTWTGSPFAANTTQNVSALGLSAGVYVTVVEINYGTAPVTFAASGTSASRPTLTGLVSSTARDGSSPTYGTAINNTNASLSASYGNSQITPVLASAVANIPAAAPAVTLSKASANPPPFLGQAFTWQLNPVNSGNTLLDSLVLTDTLPGNYTLQSVFTGTGYANSPGGSYISLRYKTTANSSYTSWTGGPFAANQTLPVSGLGLSGGVYVTHVEFNFGAVPFGFAASGTATQRPSVTGVINNPTPNSTTVADGSTSQNSATLAATYSGGSVSPQTATSTVTIPNTTKTATFSKSASNASPWVGQSFGWRLRPISTGTAPLDNFTITDTLPDNFTLESVTPGTSYTNSSGGSYISIRYKTTSNSSFTAWPGSPFAESSTPLLVSALGLAVGEYVTVVEMNFGTVPVGFAAGSAANRPTLTGVITNPARNGSSATGATTISNANATLTASYGGVSITPVVANTVTATVSSTPPVPALTKTASSANPPIGQAFSYYLRPVSAATILNNFIVVDTLPGKFALNSITPGINYVNSPGGNFISVRYKTTSNASFTTWPGSPFTASSSALPVSALSLAVEEYVTVVEFDFGTVSASFAASATGTEQPRLTGIVNDPARDGSVVNTGDVITNPATLNANYNGAALATVNSSVNVTMAAIQATSSLTKTVSKASPAIGQVFDWRLSPANTGIYALDNFILTDTLPSQFTLTSITPGTSYANSPGGGFIAVRYKTSSNSTFTAWPGSPFAESSTALPVSALNLGVGVYVTAVEFNFGTVPIGFATSSTAGNKPKLTGLVNSPARDGSTVVATNTIVNSNTSLAADYNGDGIAVKTASATATMTWGTDLTKTSSAASYGFGQSVIWRLRPQNSYGATLNNFVVIDTLPSQFELTSIYAGQSWTDYVTPTVSYTTTTNSNFVVWAGAFTSNVTKNVSSLGLANGVYITAVKLDYGTVLSGFSASATGSNQMSLTGIVNKAARDGSTVSTVAPITNIVNNATSTATIPSGSALQLAPASATVTMTTPTLTTTFSKVASPTTQQLGQSFGWQLSPAAATTPSTISLDNFTIMDTLPGQFELQSVYTGTGYSNSPTGNFINIRYKTTANSSFTTWTGSPFAAGTTLNVSGLGLSTGVYVTVVEINYGTVAGNFAASATASSKPRLTGVVNSPARNGATVADNGTVTNSNATLDATFGGVAATQRTASASVTLTTVKVKPVSVKSVVTSGPYVPGGTVTFRVETANDATSQGSMVNPVGTDLLPDQVDYLPGTFAQDTTGTYNSAGVAAPVLTVIPNFSGTRTLLRWQYTGSFAANTRATVTFNVMVRAGTASGTYPNLSGASAAAGTNQEMVYPTGVIDTLDLNGNSSSTDYLSPSSTASFVVGASPAMDATKWVKGVLDKVYTKYPDYGVTVAGGSINYRIDMTNVGTVNLTNLTLIDILPAVGDVGVIDTSQRLSRWTPELTGSASAPIIEENATVYYTTEPDPDRTEVGGPATGNPPNWSTTPPLDLTTIRAFKVVWDSSVVLAPGQTLEFNVPMRAPLDAADGTIAWNSFAWSASPPVGYPDISAEPNKVGVGALNTGKAIGNFVWLDEDSDGHQDPGEPGLANVRVNLYNSLGTVVGTTVTDTTGHYLFPHLGAEDYFVRVDASTLPSGVTQTTLSTRPNSDFGNQDQSIGANDYGYLIPATNSSADSSADFGYNYNPTADVNGNTGTCMIGDRVWLDFNGDGKQAPDEIGVAGVQVQLVTAGPDGLANTADDVTAATTTTDVTGYYRFDGLSPGAYQVRVSSSTGASLDVLSSAYSQTGDPDHFASTSSSSNDNRMTGPIVLGPGDVFLNADFGYHPVTATLGTIGDFVWLDANASGTATADTGEFGFKNVTVALIMDVNGNGIWDTGEPIVSTSVTNASGAYQFAGIPLSDAGDGNAADADYLVWINDTYNILAQPRQTYDNDGIVSSEISAISLSAGTPSVVNQDFSYAPSSQPDNTTAVIGDRIWFDANRDGVQDATELGIPQVLMELVDTLGRVLALTLTDNDGYYFFGGLTPTSTYTVRVAARNFLLARPLAGMVNTYDANGGLDGTSMINLATVGSDGNADPDGIKNQSNLGQDFGYGPPSGVSNQGSIGNLIWLDNNADGICAGVNGADATPNTDDDEPGIQGVTVNLYRDLDHDGVLDSGEPLVATTTTDADGAYLFTGLPLTDADYDPLLYASDPDASYLVEISDRNGVLRGYWHSLGTAATNNNSQTDPYAITLTTASPNVLSSDYGYYVEPATIGNYIWLDTNGNGLQDEVGSGLVGIEVVLTITYPGGTVTTLKALTDASGYYSFGNLLQDEDYTSGSGGTMPSFVVSVSTNQSAMDSYTRTHIGVGSNPRADSNNPSGTSASASKGFTNVTGFVTPSSLPTYDFGYFPTSELLSLGNRVWRDVNNNGSVDVGEAGLTNVKVELLDSTAATVLATAYTDANGFYRFDQLLPDTYYVRIAAENWTGISGSPGGTLDGTAPLATYISSLGNANAAQTSGTAAVSGIDHGVDNVARTTTGIKSLAVTVGVGSQQPLTDLDVGSTGAGENGPNGDSRDNLALDFGFQLQACPDSWAAWLTEWTTPLGGATGVAQNPDLDRYDNLVEYAFCLPPSSGIMKPFCLQPGLSGQIDGVFHRTAGGTTDVTYTLEYKAALSGAWSNPGVTIVVGSNASFTTNGDGTETVLIPDLESKTGLVAGEGFVRLRVTLAGGATSTTEVLGWTETALSHSCSTFNNPYVRCSSFTGTADGTSGHTLDLAGSVGSFDLQTVITGANNTAYVENSYYVEVTSGAYEGHRFDIASVNATSVVLATDSEVYAATPPFNTLTTVPNLAGATLIIRRHWTLAEQFPVAGFNADTTAPLNSPADADQVQIFVNGGWTTYYLYDQDGTGVTYSPKWVKLVGDLSDQGASVLPPGQGMFVSKPQFAVQVLSYGEVRDCDFIRPLQAGNNLMGGGYPIDQSAHSANPSPYYADRAMALGEATIGFFGSRDFKTADSFFIWKGDTTAGLDGYDSYFLLSAASPVTLRWVKVGDAALNAKDGLGLFLSDRGVFVRAKYALPSYVTPCPWLP